jgi:hypothetical protein
LGLTAPLFPHFVFWGTNFNQFPVIPKTCFDPFFDVFFAVKQKDLTIATTQRTVAQGHNINHFQI